MLLSKEKTKGIKKEKEEKKTKKERKENENDLQWSSGVSNRASDHRAMRTLINLAIVNRFIKQKITLQTFTMCSQLISVSLC